MWQWLPMPLEAKQHRWEDAAAAGASALLAPRGRGSNMGDQRSLAFRDGRDSTVTAQTTDVARDCIWQELLPEKGGQGVTEHGSCYTGVVKCDTRYKSARNFIQPQNNSLWIILKFVIKLLIIYTLTLWFLLPNLYSQPILFCPSS